MSEPTPEQLLPCRACGAPCRVERFEGGPIEGVMTVYFCANSTKFGGNCPDPHAYLNINAWNERVLERPSDEAVEPRFFIDHGMIHDRVTGKHVSTEPIEFDEGQFDTSPMLEACALLNELASRAAIAAMREQSK